VVADLQRRLVELRFVEGIEKVEHVPYPTGDQFWVRFNSKLDFGKFEDIAKKHGCGMVRFASLPSKLPRPIAEMLWDGVSHVITKNISGWTKFTAFFGSEPDGIAKIATDLHGPYEIYIAMQEEGVQILYEYLGLNYVPPALPPKPVTPAKPAVPTAVKPGATAPRPVPPPTPVTAKPTPPTQPTHANPPQAAKAPEPPKPTAPVVEQNKDAKTQSTG
jgi:hypothetical protein